MLSVKAAFNLDYMQRIEFSIDYRLSQKGWCNVYIFPEEFQVKQDQISDLINRYKQGGWSVSTQDCGPGFVLEIKNDNI